MCRQACELEDAIARLDAQLKEQKKAHQAIIWGSLIEALDEAGIPKFELIDGTKIAVGQQLTASVPERNKAEAAQWLQDHGLGSLVSDDVVVHLTKGDGRHDALREMLLGGGFDNIERKPGMNTGSIKASIKEMLERGDDVPMELFGAFNRRIAIIKRPK